MGLHTSSKTRMLCKPLIWSVSIADGLPHSQPAVRAARGPQAVEQHRQCPTCSTESYRINGTMADANLYNAQRTLDALQACGGCIDIKPDVMIMESHNGHRRYPARPFHAHAHYVPHRPSPLRVISLHKRRSLTWTQMAPLRRQHLPWPSRSRCLQQPCGRCQLIKMNNEHNSKGMTMQLPAAASPCAWSKASPLAQRHATAIPDGPAAWKTA